MEKFVNPFSDYGFKLIFGSEISKDLIISFLNSVLQEEVIVDITFRNVEMLGLKQIQGKVVFDIFCENEKGEFFIVEIQKSHQKYFSDRILYYASFAIQRQALRVKEKTRRDMGNIYEHWHYGIQKVYIVCILNYIMDSRYPDKYRWDVVRMDRELKIPFSETLCEVYLEMPKFSLPLSECTTTYLKWLYVLNNIEIMERLPEQLNNQLFQKLKSIVEIERMSVDERLDYELSLATERDILSAMETSFENGEAKGEAKGLARGKAEGLVEGELKTQQKVVSLMKKQGFDTETIAKCTGLSPEEINRL